MTQTDMLLGQRPILPENPSLRMRQAVLHIGTHKTGSTYLQSWLMGNRDHLLALGIRTATRFLHFHRVAAESVVEPERRALRFSKAVLEVQLDEAMNEICGADAEDSSQTSVISSEFFWDMPPDDVRRGLEQLGISVKKVVCFVRRQDRLEASSYNQTVKTMGLIDPYRTTPYWEGLDWNVLYHRWRDAFPEADLRFHGYDYLRRRDMVLTVFKQDIDCPETFPDEYLPDRAKSNISLDAEVLEIVRMANQRQLFELSKQLDLLSDEIFREPAFGFAQDVVSEIENTYRPGNVLLADRLRSDDIAEVALPGWQSDGSDLYGIVPSARILDLLGWLERRLVESGTLPRQQAPELISEPLILLHGFAKESGVTIGTLLATAETDLDRKESKMSFMSAEGDNTGFPVDCALEVLEFATTLLNRTSNKRSAAYRTNRVEPFEGRARRGQAFKQSIRPKARPVALKSDWAHLSRTVKHFYDRAVFRLRHPFFDAKQYLASHPDLLTVGMNPFTHYSTFGRKEGRTASPIRRLVPPFRVANALKLLGSSSQINRKRPTVLVVLHEGSRTGAPIIGYNLVSGLLRKFNVFVLFLNGGPVAQACSDIGAVVAIARRRCRSWSEGAYFIRQLCQAHCFKFAIVNSVEARFVLGGLKVEGIPTVSLIHEFASYIIPTNHFRYAVELSDETVFPARIVWRDAIDLIPELASRSFHVIPQGLCELPSSKEHRMIETAEEIRQKMGIPRRSAETVVIVGVAYVSFRKGVDFFIQCASRILRSNPGKEVHFVWVGGAYKPEKDGSYSVFLADQIRREGLVGKLHFIGEIQNMTAVYDEADIFLLTSRLDPLPNVALEALCHGLPLVCFDGTTGIAEFLSKVGLSDECIARFLDVDDMAQKASKFVQSERLRRRVVEASKGAALRTFSSDRYCAQIEGLALELVGNEEVRV